MGPVGPSASNCNSFSEVEASIFGLKQASPPSTRSLTSDNGTFNKTRFTFGSCRGGSAPIDKFDGAMGKFALAYADRAGPDHAALKAAVRAGTIDVNLER
jgi:hypothetical protein